MRSPTITVPGSAADCSREAVLTRSPVTRPWPTAPSAATASPVSTPTRACSGTPSRSPSAVTASTTTKAERTARSASSSWATGVPHTAITASPMNFSTTPPCRSTASDAVAKYSLRMVRTSSGSRPSASGVDPTRSANSTVTRRRSVPWSGATGCPVPGCCAPEVVPGRSCSASGRPHSPQNLSSGAFAVPQAGQVSASRWPHSLQNLRPGSLVVPQTAQSIEFLSDPPNVATSPQPSGHLHPLGVNGGRRLSLAGCRRCLQGPWHAARGDTPGEGVGTAAQAGAASDGCEVGHVRWN